MCYRSSPVNLYISNVPDDDVRGPKVTRSLIMQQPANYCLQKEMIKGLISSTWALLLLSSQGSPLEVPAGLMMRLDRDFQMLRWLTRKL